MSIMTMAPNEDAHTSRPDRRGVRNLVPLHPPLLEVTSMHLRPLHDRIIVQRLDEESTQRIGTIVIPDSAKEKPQLGKVLAAGLGKSNDEGERLPMDVKAGDTVLFGKYSGQEVSVDGVEYLIMKEDDVLAIQERTL
jgi:chaperonin GroES